MKRNLLSIVILALVLVNTVLTVVMMVSVVGTAKKTGALIDGISAALDLEVESQKGAATTVDVPMTDTEVYSIAESMRILLKDDGSGEPHYCMLQVSFSINTKSDGYATYGSDLSNKEPLIRDEITTIVSQYTMDEARSNQNQIKQAILDSVQTMYDSDFIFNVSFGECLFQ